MGYYTNYVVEAHMFDGTIVDESTIEDWLKSISGYSFKLYEPTDGIKWYNYEKDMVELSKDFPHIFFKVIGDGEETGDNWIQVFVNGNTEYSKAEFVYTWPDGYTDKSFYVEHAAPYVPPPPVYKISEEEYNEAVEVLRSIVFAPTAPQIKALQNDATAVVIAYKNERGL